MTPGNGKASIREVHNLIGETRKEIMDSIIRLESKFDTMEAGRLTKLEKQLANLEGKNSVISAVVSFVVSVAILIIGKYLL